MAMAQQGVAQELAQFSIAVPGNKPCTRARAAAYCRRFVRRNYENFSVASWLLPRRLKPHFYAIYAYCRWADDLADEVGDSRYLDWWREELHRCYAGDATHPVFVALRSTIDEFSIPPEPFERLLTAFEQDQRVVRYRTPDDVLGYCRNSANPVGELILYLGRCHDRAHTQLSDSICTGLQLINFCQDVGRDWHKGRIYLPQETLEAAGCDTDTFQRGKATEAFRRALRVEVDRAESYLRQGGSLIGQMPGELRLQVALFQAGGLCVAAAIRDLDYDVWSVRPTVSRWRKLQLLARCWWQTDRRRASLEGAR